MFKTKLYDINSVSPLDWIDQLGPFTFHHLQDAFRSGQEVTVDCISVAGEDRLSSYYDITLQDGTVIGGLSGYHLVDIDKASIPCWRWPPLDVQREIEETSVAPPVEDYSNGLGAQYVIELTFPNYRRGPIDHGAIEEKLLKMLRDMFPDNSPTVAYETDYPLADPVNL